jgi:hypothetical protein
MAGTATELGSLIWRFLGDTTSVDKAGEKVAKDMTKLEKDTKKRAEAIAKSVVKIGAAFSAAALGVAYSVKRSIDEMDKLGKTAQKIGFPVEELSAWRYAAELSDVSVESLSTSLNILNRNLGDVAANGTSAAANAFNALGITVTQADGTLRATGDLLLDVADKFQSYEDGANKSAIAMAIFGRSGAELIPLLNEGSSAIRKQMEEARKLGVTFSEDAAKKANEFNDSITKLTERLKGWAISIANEVLPTMNEFLDKLDRAINLGPNWFLAFIPGDESQKRMAESVGRISNMMDRLIDKSQQLPSFDDLMRSRGGDQGLGSWEAKTTAEAPSVADQAAVDAEALRAGAAAGEHYSKVLSDTLANSSLSAVDKLKALDDAVRRGTIGFYDYGEAVKSVGDENKQQMLDLASATSSALTQIFGENKAAAIAAAIINTAVGITKAMQLPPPFNFAQAALIAATGAAQIAAIRSTSKSGGGAAPSAGGGGGSFGGSSGGAPNAAPGASSPGNQNTLHVSGIGATDLFTGEMVRSLSDHLLKYQRDGGKVVLGGII